MKKMILAVVFILVTYSVGFCETYKGYFITYADKTIVVNSFDELKNAGKFFCKYEGNSIGIPYSKIKSMTSLDMGRKTVLIERRDGVKFEVKADSSLRVGWYSFYDIISESYSSAAENDVKRIVFDEDFGDLRKCPKCSRTYIPEYMFCPYDKTQMKLIKIK